MTRHPRHPRLDSLVILFLHKDMYIVLTIKWQLRLNHNDVHLLTLIFVDNVRDA